MSSISSSIDTISFPIATGEMQISGMRRIVRVLCEEVARRGLDPSCIVPPHVLEYAPSAEQQRETRLAEEAEERRLERMSEPELAAIARKLSGSVHRGGLA